MERAADVARMEGLLLVDKAVGPSSFDVVAEVRRRLGARRARELRVGHAGTLDPLASGLLPVLVGEATKLVPYLMGLDKVYEATVRLGAATDTDDAEGRTIAVAEPERVASVTEERVRAALGRFVGRIAQRPPAYSAIKQGGKRLYELARADEAVEAREREVVVHELALARFAPPDLELRVVCGKGTYVRSLGRDLGEALGVHGHVVALRRTRIGDLDVAEAIALGALAAGRALPLLPIGRAVAHLPALVVDGEVERRLRLGQQAALRSLATPADLRGAVRLVDEAGRLVAIADASPEGLALARVLHRPG